MECIFDNLMNSLLKIMDIILYYLVMSITIKNPMKHTYRLIHETIFRSCN